jgi:succinate dehydrogenase / fumarate reductase cytochrome b subunit
LVTVTTTTSTTAARARASTIVWKLAMAVTGLVFIGYLLLHMYGNLKVFAGQDSFDEYAHHLRVFGEPILPENGLLWIVRVVLLLSLVIHAAAAFKLWARASKARGHKYAVKKAVAATLSSRTMRWGGVALLLFVVFHILHLTTHTINPGGNPESPYQRMVNGFSPDNWWVPVIYLLAMVALAMHLRHGVWSAAQTMGLTNTPQARARFNMAGYTLALVIAGGFALVPLSVLFGIVE